MTSSNLEWAEEGKPFKPLVLLPCRSSCARAQLELGPCHTETCQDSGVEMLSGVLGWALMPVPPPAVTAWPVTIVGCRSSPPGGGNVVPAFPQELGTAGGSNPSLNPHSCPASAPPCPSSSTLADESSPSSFSRDPEKEILHFSAMSRAPGARCSAEQSQLPRRATRRQSSLLSHCQQLPELTARQRRALGTSHSHFLPNISTVSKSPSF